MKLLLIFLPLVTAQIVKLENQCRIKRPNSSFPLLDAYVREYDTYHLSITYLCQGVCGGLGDRLKGTMSIAKQAILRKRKFHIEHSLWSDYYSEGVIKWKIPPPPSITIDCIDQPCNCMFDFIEKHPNENLKLRVNTDCGLLDWRFYEKVFIPGKWMPKEEVFIGMHIRVGGKRLNDAQRLNEADLPRIIKNYVSCYHRLSSCKVVIATDNEFVYQSLKLAIPNSVGTHTFGSIGHVERYRTENSDIRMLIEFELLRNVQVLLRPPYSGFSIVASKLSRGQWIIQGDTCQS
jgi:hypothetical protein